MSCLTEKQRLFILKLNENATIPTKAHATDSGFDLYAAKDVIIEPGETVVVPTGIAIQLPEGTEAQVRPRSGVTSKSKLRVQLGTIDNAYRGEIGIIVDNIFQRDLTDDYEKGVFPEALTVKGDLERVGGREPFGSYLIRKGDKIAQLVVQYLPKVEALEVDELTDGERGANGFGSTGVSNA